MWPQSGTIFVKSANGQIDQRPVSKPLALEDEATGVTTCLPFVLIKNCPVNLLGRDGMEKLRLSLVPVTGGMRAVGPGQKIEDQIFVQKAVNEPHYYWSLNMPRPDLTGTGKKLIEMITPQEHQQVKAPEELHMTIRYKKTPGPDKPFDDKVTRLGPQKVTFRMLYQDDHGNVAVSVGIPQPVQALMQDSQVPHVSVVRGPGVLWKDLGHIVREGDQATDWEDDKESGWQRSGGLRRKHLGFMLTMTPRAHLDDNDLA